MFFSYHYARTQNGVVSGCPALRSHASNGRRTLEYTDPRICDRHRSRSQRTGSIRRRWIVGRSAGKCSMWYMVAVYSIW